MPTRNSKTIFDIILGVYLFLGKVKGFEMPAKKKPKRDACYYKVKRAMPKTSACRSGHMVRGRKVGAKNYNIGGKKNDKK